MQGQDLKKDPLCLLSVCYFAQVYKVHSWCSLSSVATPRLQNLNFKIDANCNTVKERPNYCTFSKNKTVFLKKSNK